MKTMKFATLIVLVAAFLVGSLIKVACAGRFAYNDCIRQTGGLTAANVTDRTISSGHADRKKVILSGVAGGHKH